MEIFTALDACSWIGLGFVVAGSVFYPLAILLTIVRAFKGS